MASSAYDTYGKLLAKNLYCDESGIVFHDANDDTKTITLKATGIGAGNADITLPTSAGALLSAGSNLNGANLSAGSVATAALADNAVTADKVDIASATDIGAGLADADSFFVSDSDAADAVKRVTGAALKTFIGSTSLQPGDIDNSNLFAANVVDANALADNAVDAGAIANDAVVEAKIQNNAVTKAKIADAPTTYGTAEASKLVAVDASKDLSGLNDVSGASFVASGVVQAGAAQAFRLGGDADGSFRMAIDSGNFVIQKKVTGAWETWLTVSAPA